MRKHTIILTAIMLVAALSVLSGCTAIANWMDKVTGNQSSTQQPTPEKEALGTPDLLLDGNVIRWTAIKGADRYRVKYTNVERAEPTELLVYQPQFDTDDLDLSAGEYLFVVRAECTTGDYLDGTYTLDEDGVRIIINTPVSLDDVTMSFYRVDDSTVLCVWTEKEGADVYHLQVGNNVVDATGTFALITADATHSFEVTLSISGKAGYPYAGLGAVCVYDPAEAGSATTADYDKKEAELELSILNATAVTWDGQVLSQSFSGKLTLSGDMLREQTVGMHYLVATTRHNQYHVLVYVQDTRPLVFTNGVGVAISEMDYILGARGLTVYVVRYTNTITAIAVDDVPLQASQYSLEGDTLMVMSACMSELGEGDHVLKVQYNNVLGVSASTTLSVHVSAPAALQYDAATASDYVLNNIPEDTTKVLGGGISVDDYSISGTTLTMRASYLGGLSAGTYEYWLAGPNGDLLSLEVFNSAGKPYNVVLSYDDHATYAYGHYQCDCGMDQHYYSLDGGAKVALDGTAVNLGELDKTLTHTFTVYCTTNNTQASYSVKPNAAAVGYMSTRFEFEGRTPDCYIGTVDEFAEVVRYLSYAGGVNYSKSTYGTAEMAVYIGNDVMSKSGSLDNALSALLSAARQGMASPYDCAISASGSSFDSDTRMGALTVTVTFGSAIAKTHVNDIEADAYKDTRTLLSENATPRTTYIENIAVTETVNNVQELADLPMGVRPVFSGTDDATNAARQTWQAALGVCQTYIRDGMTTTQKLQAMYDYFSRYVTYDYYALIWFEVDNYRKSMEQNAYAQWRNAANSYAAGCSDAERTAINGVTSYRSAAELVATNASAYPSNSFWTSWQSSFADFEDTAMSNLRAYARQQVEDRGYERTSLENDVETMCAKTTYRATVDTLEEMNASSAFDAYGALVGNVSVCDGIADAFRLLCMVEGIPCMKISGIGTNSSGGSEAHAWNKVLVGGTWYCVDATWSKASGCVSHRYFLVPDSVLSADHLEQIGEVAAVQTLALATDYNYYVNTTVAGTNLYVENLDALSGKLKTLYNAGERTIELYVATCPDRTMFENALRDAVGGLKHLGSLSYSYVYSNGYALVVF